MDVTEINIALMGLIFTIIVGVVGWFIMFRKDRKQRAKEKEEERKAKEAEAIQSAYEKGVHDSEHKKLTTQLNATHDKIRKNGADIATINTTLSGHTEMHERLLNGQETQQESLTVIQSILMDGRK